MTYLLKIYTITAVLLSIELDDTLCYSRKINVKRNNNHRTHVYSNLQSSKREHPFGNYTFKRRNSTITSFSRNFPKNIIFSPEYYYSGKKRKTLTVNGTKRDILLLPQVDTGILTGQPTQVLQNQLYQNSYRFAPQSALNLIGSRRQSEYVDEGYASKSQDESYALPADDRLYGEDRSDADSSYILPQSSAQIANAPESTRAIFEDSIPTNLLKMEGLQQTEENLVGKLVSSSPQGTSKSTTESAVAQPHYNEGYRNVVDSILLDKLLNPHAQRNNVTCDPVARSAAANCSNSTDPLCYDSDLHSFRKHGLVQHITFRNVHSTPPIELNDVLNQEAQMYAEKLSNMKLAYSDPKERPGQGENIAVRCSDDKTLLTAKEAVSYWYNKVCKNDFHFDGYSPELSQFAQVVWKGSNYLGMGRATKKNGDLMCTYIVARYSPQASKDGFVENVPKGDFNEIGFCSKKCLTGVPDEDNAKISVENKSSDSTVKDLSHKDGSSSYNKAHKSLKDLNQYDDLQPSQSSTFDNMPGNLQRVDEIDNDSPSPPNSKAVSVPMIIKSVGNVIVPGTSNMSRTHKTPVNASSRQMKKGNGNRNPALVSFHADHGTHVFENLRQGDTHENYIHPTIDALHVEHKHLQEREKGLTEEIKQEKSLEEKIKSNEQSNIETGKKFISKLANTENVHSAKFSSKNNNGKFNVDETNKQPETGSTHDKGKQVNSFAGNRDNTESVTSTDNKTNTKEADVIKNNTNDDASNATTQNDNNLFKQDPNSNGITVYVKENEYSVNDKSEQTDTNNSSRILPNSSNSLHRQQTSRNNPDIMVFINKSSNEVQDIQQKMNEMISKEKTVSDSQPEKESSQEAPVELRINNTTKQSSDGEDVHNEKETTKSSDSTTRHMLQNFFQDVQVTPDVNDARYIQLLPSRELSEFRDEIWKKHNAYRMLHGSAPLLLDNDLSRDAQLYAAYAAKHGTVAHSNTDTRPDTGESVAEMCTKEGVLPSAEHVVNKWYSEVCNPGYDFTKDVKQPGTGHFTQIIWRDTQRLGVGLAVADTPSGDSCSYVVTRYKNAGNYLGKFQENVLPGFFDKSRCSDDPNFDKDIDPVLGNLNANFLPAQNTFESAMKRGAGHQIKNAKRLSSKKGSEPKYMFKKLKHVKPEILEEILHHYTQSYAKNFTNKVPQLLQQQKPGLSNALGHDWKELKSPYMQPHIESRVEEDPQSKSIILKSNHIDRVYERQIPKYAKVKKKKDSLIHWEKKNNIFISRKKLNHVKTKRDVTSVNKIDIETVMSNLENVKKRSIIKKVKRHAKKKVITDDDNVIDIAMRNNLHPSVQENISDVIKNISFMHSNTSRSSKRNNSITSSKANMINSTKPEKIKELPRSAKISNNTAKSLNHMRFKSGNKSASRDASLKTSHKSEKESQKTKNQTDFLKKAESTTLSREEMEKGINKIINETVISKHSQTRRVTKKVTTKPKNKGKTSTSSSHVSRKNVTKTKSGKHTVTKMNVKQKLISNKVKVTKQLQKHDVKPMKTTRKTSLHLKVTGKNSTLNPLQGNKTTTGKKNTTEDDDLEKYLKSIVVKLHNFDKKTNAKNKQKFDSEIKTFAILNEQAIQFKTMHGVLNKQSTIPESPLSKLEKLTSDFAKKRTFENAITEPLDSSIDDYVKSFTKATSDKPISGKLQRRLVKINNVLKENTDDPTPQELDSLAKFYDRDFIHANEVASTLSPLPEHVKGTRSNFENQAIKNVDTTEHDSANEAIVSEDDGDDDGEPEEDVSEMEEDNLVPDKENKFQSKEDIENASQQLESLSSIEKTHTVKPVDETSALMLPVKPQTHLINDIELQDNPTKLPSENKLGIKISPEEIRAINHEAKVFGDHITNTLFYHDEKNHPTYFKPIKSIEKIPDHAEGVEKETLQHAVETSDVNKASDQWLDEAEKLQHTTGKSNTKVVEHIGSNDGLLLQYDDTSSGIEPEELKHITLNHARVNKRPGQLEKIGYLIKEAEKAVSNELKDEHDGENNKETSESKIKEGQGMHVKVDHGKITKESGSNKFVNTTLKEKPLHSFEGYRLHTAFEKAKNTPVSDTTVGFKQKENDKETQEDHLKENSHLNDDSNNDNNTVAVTVKYVDTADKPHSHNKDENNKNSDGIKELVKIEKKLEKEKESSHNDKEDKGQNDNEDDMKPLKIKKPKKKPVDKFSPHKDKETSADTALLNKDKETPADTALLNKPLGSQPVTQGQSDILTDDQYPNADENNLGERPEDPSPVQQSALMAHNKLRRIHHAPALELSKELSKQAQKYANDLVRKHDGVLVDSPFETRLDQGENLAINCDPQNAEMTGEEASYKWYSEICEHGYNFDTPSTSTQGTEHFSQLIWKASRYIGIGKSLTKRNGMTCTIIVARYQPKGNIPEQFLKNIDEGDFDASVCDAMTTKAIKSPPVTDPENNELPHPSPSPLSEDPVVSPQKQIHKEQSGVPKLNTNANLNDQEEKLQQQSLNIQHLSHDDTVSNSPFNHKDEHKDAEQEIGEHESVSSFYRPHKTTHLIKNAFEVLDQHELSDTGKSMHGRLSSHGEKPENKEKEQSHHSYEAKKPLHYLQKTSESEQKQSDDTQVVHVSLNASPIHVKLGNSSFGFDSDVSEHSSVVHFTDGGIKSDHNRQSDKPEKTTGQLLKSVEQENLSKDDSDNNMKGIEGFVSQDKENLIGLNSLQKNHRPLQNNIRIVAPAVLQKTHEEIEDTTSIVPSLDHMNVKGEKQVRFGKQHERQEGVQQALADILRQNPGLLQNLKNVASNDKNKNQHHAHKVANLAHNNDDDTVVFNPKQEDNEKLVDPLPHNLGGNYQHHNPSTLSNKQDQEDVSNMQPKVVATGNEHESDMTGHANTDKQESDHHKRPGDTNYVPKAPIKLQDNDSTEDIPEKKPDTSLHPVPDNSEQKPLHPLNASPFQPPEDLQQEEPLPLKAGKPQVGVIRPVSEAETVLQESPVSLKPTKPQMSVMKPISGLHPTEEPVAHPKPISSSVSDADEAPSELSTESADTMGTFPSFGFASFGSPVVLHLGDTGYSEDPGAFLRIGLSVHNRLRKIHGSPPVKIDPMLTMQALKHATELTHLGYLKHQSTDLLMGMGENLLMGCYDGEYDISAEEAVLRWYAEVCHPGYCFNQSTTCSGTGHFSQVVWANSTRLGMAKATRMQNGLRCTYVVARYFPGGNENVGYSENVKTGGFEEKKVCADVFKNLLTFSRRNEEKAKMVEKEKHESRMEFLKNLRQAEQQTLNQIDMENGKNPPLPPFSSTNEQASPYGGKNKKLSGDDEPEMATDNKNGVVEMSLLDNNEHTTSSNIETYDKTDGGHKWMRKPGTEAISQQAVSLDNSRPTQLSSSATNVDVDHDNPVALNSKEDSSEQSTHQTNEVSDLNKIQIAETNKDPEIAEIKRLEAAIRNADDDSRVSHINQIGSAVQNTKQSDTEEQVEVETENRRHVARKKSLTGQKDRQENSKKHADILIHEDKNTMRAKELDKQEENNSLEQTADVIEKYLQQVKDMDNYKSRNKAASNGDDKSTIHEIHSEPIHAWETAGLPHSKKYLELITTPLKAHVKTENELAVSKESPNGQNHSELSSQYKLEEEAPHEVTSTATMQEGASILPVLQHTVTHKVTEQTIHPLNPASLQVQGAIHVGEVDQHKLLEQEEEKQISEQSEEELNKNERGKEEAEKTVDKEEGEKMKKKQQKADEKKEEDKIKVDEKDDEKDRNEKKLEKQKDEKKQEKDKEKEMEKERQKEEKEKELEEERKENDRIKEKEDEKEEEQAREEEEKKEQQLKLKERLRLEIEEKERENKKLKEKLQTEEKEKEMQQYMLKLKLFKEEEEEKQQEEQKQQLEQQQKQQLLLQQQQKQQQKQQEQQREKVDEQQKQLQQLLQQKQEEERKKEERRQEEQRQEEQRKEEQRKEEKGKEEEKQLEKLKLQATLQAKLQNEKQEEEISEKLPPTQQLPLNHIKQQETQGAKVLTVNPSTEEQVPSNLELNELNIDENPPLRISCADKMKNAKIHHDFFDCSDNNAQKVSSAPVLAPMFGDISLFQLSALNAHNTYRRTHQVPTLRLNQEMSLDATEYAKKIAKLGSLKHSKTDDGENIATVCRNKNMLMTGQEATNVWYREVCDPGYDFVAAQAGKAGHFTQVVWKDSKEFGIGRAAEMHNGLLCTYIVARYRPAGNFINEFAENVPRGNFHSQQCINLARKDEILHHPGFNYKRSDVPKVRKPRSTHNGSVSNRNQGFLTNISATSRITKKKLRRVTLPKKKIHNGAKFTHINKDSRSKNRPTKRSRNIKEKRKLQRTRKRKRFRKKTHAHKKDEMPHQVIIPFLGFKNQIEGRRKQLESTNDMRYAHKKGTFSALNNSLGNDEGENTAETKDNPEDIIGKEFKQTPMVAIKHIDESKGPVAELNHLFKLKFSENSGVIVPPLYAKRRKVGCDINSNQPKCKPSIVPLSLDALGVPNAHLKSDPYRQTTHASIQRHDEVSASSLLHSNLASSTSSTLHLNKASVEIAQRLGNDLLKRGKFEDNKKSQALSSLAAGAKLPSDLLLGDSGVGTMQDILKMAKIGSIALQLAKKQQLQRELSGSSLRRYDLLHHLQRTETSSTKPTMSLLNDQGGVSSKDNIQSECAGTRDCVINNAVAKAVENTFKNLAKQTISKTDENATLSTAGAALAQQNHSVNSSDATSEKYSEPLNKKDSQDEEFLEATLNAHNAFRNVHNVDPLILDENLNQEASLRAQTLAGIGELRQSRVENKEGENLAMSCKDGSKEEKMTGPDATLLWYNQVCNPEFVFDVDRPQKFSDQFTQVVWKNTQKLGIGRSTFLKSGNFCTIIVARYYPSASKSDVRSNVLQGSYDSMSYCNGLGAVVDVGDSKQKKSKNLGSVSANTEDFRQEALNLQNEFRAVHDSPSMELDESLCLEAEMYATKLAESAGTQHSDTSDGESIIKSCTTNMEEMNGDEAVRKWYNEVCHPGYSFLSDKPANGTSSFTQMVWKTTKSFGIGKATSQEDGMLCTYIVGRYHEKGNSPGSYKDNVLKGRFDFRYCEGLGQYRRKSKNNYLREKKVESVGSKRYLSNMTGFENNETKRYSLNSSKVDISTPASLLTNNSVSIVAPEKQVGYKNKKNYLQNTQPANSTVKNVVGKKNSINQTNISAGINKKKIKKGKVKKHVLVRREHDNLNYNLMKYNKIITKIMKRRKLKF